MSSFCTKSVSSKETGFRNVFLGFYFLKNSFKWSLGEIKADVCLSEIIRRETFAFSNLKGIPFPQKILFLIRKDCSEIYKKYYNCLINLFLLLLQ